MTKRTGKEKTVTGRVVAGVSKEEEEVATRRVIDKHRWYDMYESG